MRERNFYMDEWEEMVSQKADQVKMYPSDKVWKGIYASLHTRKKRFILGMSSLICAILFFAAREILLPANPVPHTLSRDKTLTAFTATKELPDIKPNNPSSVQVTFPGVIKPGLDAIRQPDRIAENDNSQPKTSMLTNIGSDILQENSGVLRAPSASYNNIATAPPVADALSTSRTRELDNSNLVSNTIPPTRTGSMIRRETLNDIQSARKQTPLNTVNTGVITVETAGTEHADKEQATKSALESPVIRVDDIGAALLELKRNENNMAEEDRLQIGWLEHYAPQQLTPSKKYKFSWQAYVSPTANYRKLSGNGNYVVKPRHQSVPLAPAYPGNPNAAVNNSPAEGLEIGGSLLYRVTRNLIFKVGLQFDYSRYGIKAYASNPQFTTINLNAVNGYTIDSIRSISSVGNYGGKSVVSLQNQYFQLSAPIGLEMRVLGNSRLQLNIAGTVQPTYLLNKNSWLLSSDYTNYTKEPSLFRRWNVNAGIEAFLSYQIGGFRWQIGPQFRYQILSTYSAKYPLRENLMEYGLKIGISKTIR